MAWSQDWSVFGLRGGKVAAECPLCWPQDALGAIAKPHAVCFGRIGRFGWWSDPAGPRPDQSIVVGLAEFDPGFHARQIVCWDFVGFIMAVLVLAVQGALLLYKPPGAGVTFVIPFGPLVDVLV